MPPVVEVPQLRALVLRVPLAEVVAEGHDALLRPCPLLVAARAAERRVEVVLGNRVQQRHRLQAVARGPRARLLDRAPAVDRLLHARHDQLLAQFRHAAVAELDHLGEVVAGVHVHQRERERRRAERLLREAQQHDRVLAAAEQQHRALQFRGDLAHHVDRLALQCPQVAQLRARRHAHGRSPALTVHASSPFMSLSRTNPAPWHVEQAGQGRSERSVLCTRAIEDADPAPLYVNMQPALGLAGACPAALAAGAGLRARLAPDRGVPMIVQWVVRQVALVYPPPQVLLGPVCQRVVLPQAPSARRVRSAPSARASGPARGGCR